VRLCRAASLQDRVPGLDIAEQSLRDVCNDVSKYIRNISMSLYRVFPKLLDAPDRGINLDMIDFYSGNYFLSFGK
jgi:hypothetical protein